MRKVLVIHGPNLNLLGQREPEIYGGKTLEELNSELVQLAKTNEIMLETFQSNHEGEIIDCIHSALEKNIGYIIINPGAFTHYSYAIRDAVAAVDIPTVEVHISNIYNREEFRKTSVISPVCIGQISGLGFQGYLLAVQYVISKERVANED